MNDITIYGLLMTAGQLGIAFVLLQSARNRTRRLQKKQLLARAAGHPIVAVAR